MFVRPALVENMVPSSGPLKGGHPVTMFGSHFQIQSSLCVFDQRNAHTKFISSSQIVCLSPPSKQAVQVQVAIANAESLSTHSNISYSYVSTPRLLSIVPSATFSSSSVTVTMKGEGFAPGQHLACKFGSFIESWRVATCCLELHVAHLFFSQLCQPHLFSSADPFSLWNLFLAWIKKKCFSIVSLLLLQTAKESTGAQNMTGKS